MMMQDAHDPELLVTDLPFQPIKDEPSPTPRHAWVAPQLQELPRLIQLTLLTGDPIDGTGSSGGVSFP